jgi:hypothetical protein
LQFIESLLRKIFFPRSKPEGSLLHFVEHPV